jgi:hypothetical protein
MSRIPSFLHFAAAMAIALPASAANVIHVPSKDAPTIQAGIELAQDGDTILVAPGMYHEAIDFLGKTITVESEAGAEKTIINATGLDTSVVTVASGEGEGTTLRGFTITGGAGMFGGGVLVLHADVSVQQCRIIDNHVSQHGGGMMIASWSIVLVEGCVFESNTAQSTGGAAAIMLPSADWHRFINCKFRNNAALNGGAVAIQQEGAALFSHCAFRENVAFGDEGDGAGGGIAKYADGRLHATSCLFEDNNAYGGGGVWTKTSNPPGPPSPDWPVIEDSIFRGNVAGQGGGLHAGHSGQVIALRCIFEWNTAIGYSWGGVFYPGFGGGLAATHNSAPHVYESHFRHNHAATGGGFQARSGRIEQTSFEFNAADEGGGAYLPNLAVLEIGTTQFCANSPDHLAGPGLWIDLGGNEYLDDCPDECPPADLNCDGIVDVLDLLILLDSWGECKECGDCPADFNGDCSVDVLDLLILLDNWG